MPAFYHFLPNVSEGDLVVDDRLSVGVLASVGLADVLADVELAGEHATVCDVKKGPGGAPGALLYPKTPGAELPDVLDYRPERQSWLVIGDPAAPDRWLGWITGQPPTPGDLLRRKTYPGYLVKDTVDQPWAVPIARAPKSQFGNFPVDVVFDAAGNMKSVLKRKFLALWDVAGLIWDFYNVAAEDWSEGTKTIDEAWMARTAAAALAVNYRVGPQELTALYTIERGVLDSQTIPSILLALIDWELLDDFQKKEKRGSAAPAAASSRSTPGDEAGSPITGPVGESS